jgi:hypothetical protein
MFNCRRCFTYEIAGRVFTCSPLFDRHASSGEIMNLYLGHFWVWGVGVAAGGVDTSVMGDSVVKLFPLSPENHSSFKSFANLQPLCIFFCVLV